MTRHQRFLSTRWFGSLDALRAVSVLGVIFHHTAGHVFEGSPLAVAGTHGVSLFFAISGFLITTLLLREKERHGEISLRAFYVRRSLRIFPLYYAIILVYLGLVLAVEPNSDAGQGFVSNLPYFATYTSNWFVDLPNNGDRVIFYFAWSLATEEQFYLFWPAIEKRLPKLAPWLVLILVGFVIITGLGLTPLVEGTFLYKVMTSFAPAIGLGVLLAHVLHSEQGFSRAYLLLGNRAAPVILTALLIGGLAYPFPEYALFAIMALLVGAFVIREDHTMAAFLRFPIWKQLGSVSYGMYLMHMIVFNIIRRAFRIADIEAPPLILFLCVSIGAFIAAWLSYRYFESRFLALKDKFLR